MILPWLIAVQWLHVVAAIIFVGGHVFMAVVVWPDLLRRPAPEAKLAYDAIGRSLGPWMGSAGLVVLVMGVVRGTWLGPVQSVQTLISTPYGLTFLVAFLLTFFVMGYGGTVRKRLPERVWNGEQFRPDAARYVRRVTTIPLIILAVIIGCMVLMRFGL